MSSNFFRRLLAGGAAVLVSASLAGCGSEPAAEPAGALSFVIGARSNMPAPRLDGLALEPLDAAVENQSYVSMVVADGRPELTQEDDLLIEGANDTAREQSRQQNRRDVEDGILAAEADDEEVDLLAALDLAARTLRSQDTSPRTIVVVDSGLSTVAPLDFTREGMLDADPQEVVSFLEEEGTLPDLSGLDVVWQGMGDTAAPQEPLTIAQRKNLVAIWMAVLDGTGAAVPDFEQHPLTEPGQEDLPPVTPIPLPGAPECTPGRIVLTSADVSFHPDSAEFRDPEHAREVLDSVARQLMAAAATASLTGTTANVGDSQGQKQLSQDRAEAVSDVLVELGVLDESLTATGVGSDFPGYVPDRTSTGELDPAAAALNRKVIVESVGVGASCLN